MERKQVVVFLKSHYLLVLGFLTACAILLDLAAIAVRPLDLHEGGNITWWKIIHSVENGEGYKACDESYVPNCMITDQLTAMREPLPVFAYAMLSELTGDSSFALQLLQLVFDLLILWGVFLLGQELGGRIMGLISSSIWALYLPTLRVEAHLNGDLLAGLFVTFGLIMFTRAVKFGKTRDWIGFGLLFGMAVLSRASTLLVALTLLGVCGVSLWVFKKPLMPGGVKELSIASIVLALTISPWVIRNQIVFRQPIFGTTLVGYNLYRHNAMVVKDVVPHYVGSDEATREIKALVERVPELRMPINEAEVDRIFRQEALKLIRSHFGEYIELALYRFIPLWFNIGVLDQYGKSMMLLDYLVVVQQAILLLAFLFALWKGDWLLRLLASGVPLFMLSYMAVDSQLRYMAPVMPLVVVISVLGIEKILPRQFAIPES
jgi:4-amino-4-deoxy-L-arabinose transferase-like glycosyltransferase